MSNREFAPNGGRLRPAGGWKAWEKLQNEQAAKRAGEKRGGNNVQNLRPGRIHLIEKAPKCIALARSTGRPCRHAAVRGSQRCPQHGGLYDVPDHPANTKAGALDRLHRRIEGHEARDQFYKLPPHKRHKATQAMEGAKPRRGTYWQDLLAIAQALDLDDGGRQLFKLMQSFKVSRKDVGE